MQWNQIDIHANFVHRSAIVAWSGTEKTLTENQTTEPKET